MKVKHYVVILSWQFDSHMKEMKNYTVQEKILKGIGSGCDSCIFRRLTEQYVNLASCRLFPAMNLTAGTVYEVAVWAHTTIGDSPTALSHHLTGGKQPERPLLKARALNQTAVECSWTISGHSAQVPTNDYYCM